LAERVSASIGTPVVSRNDQASRYFAQDAGTDGRSRQAAGARSREASRTAGPASIALQFNRHYVQDGAMKKRANSASARTRLKMGYHRPSIFSETQRKPVFESHFV